MGSRDGGKIRAGLAQALAHLLARKVDVGAVLEHDRHLRQPVARNRARAREFGQPRHCVLDEEAHPLLDLERCVAGCHRIHDDLNVGDVGYGVDGKAREVPRAQKPHAHYEYENHASAVGGELDDSVQHGRSVDVRCAGLLDVGFDQVAVRGHIAGAGFEPSQHFDPLAGRAAEVQHPDLIVVPDAGVDDAEVTE